MSKLTKAARPVILLAGSGASAAIPIATLAVAAQTMTPADQGMVALSLSVSAYVAQLTGAALIESRLAAAQHEIRLPFWLFPVAAIGAAIIVLGSSASLSRALGLLLLYPVLELTRVVCVVANQARMEAYAASTVLSAAATSLLLAHLGHRQSAWAVLAIGGFAAVLLRRSLLTRDSVQPAPARVAAPLIAETAVTGIVQPILVVAISSVLGPLAAVGFRALTSLGGLMSPALGFLRLRLLSHAASRADRIVSLSLLGVFGTAVVIAGQAPIMFTLFGDAWTYSSHLGVALLVCWRLIIAISTFPFAALRRAGRTVTVLGVRAVSSVISLVLALGGAHWGGITGAIGGLLIAEAISLGIYQWKAHR
ncbi:hypothetical protein [Actinoplanes sp. NPDC049802]|uniref:hypothetical protein n=1 Tax=Actinoplanes sp. NPDC049802 TaxID=3154742 RepID=UPI0033FF6F10